MGRVKYSPEMKEQTVKYALEGNKSAKHDGLIFHSDRGNRYSSKKYRNMLAENGITPSMSAPGCPYDNSCVESFFASLKKELTYQKKYDNIEDVKKDIYRYIELFYNRKRLHSSLGYMSPTRQNLTDFV